MNSKTLEMLQKFVGEEEEENEDELEDIGQKLNLIKQKANQNKLNENNEIQKEDVLSGLIQKINNLDSKEENEKKSKDEVHNDNINDENNSDNKIRIEEEKNKEEELNNKSEVLMKIIFKKENKNKFIYFKFWNNFIKNNLNDNEKNNENENNNDNEENTKNNNESKNDEKLDINEIFTRNEEEELEDHGSNEIIIQHQNRLLSGDTNNFQILNPLTQIGDININNINIDNIFPNNNKNLLDINNNKNSENKNIICLSIYNILYSKIFLFHKMLFSSLKHKSIISNYYDKLYQLDKLNKKYEAILDEKSSIIINKTDEIEE